MSEESQESELVVEPGLGRLNDDISGEGRRGGSGTGIRE
jgi:hypothetical protein